MNALTVVEYVRENGSNPYRAWFDRLHAQAAAKVAIAVTRLELGNTSRVKAIGIVGEYRIDWGPGYRIYLGRDGEALIILLAAARSSVSRPTSNGESPMGRIQGTEGGCG